MSPSLPSLTARLSRLRPCLLAACLTTACLTVSAAIERDLGQGLSYLRVENAGEDLARLEASLTRGPIVIDLRSLKGTEAETDVLAGRLVAPPSPKAPQFVLLGPTTPTPLVAAASIAHPGRVTLAVKSPALNPDVAVQTTIDADREAFAALANGTPVEKLITETVAKERHDEASIVQDRLAGNEPKDDADDNAPDQPAAVVEKPVATVTPLATPAAPFDRVLQRAVHLHRGLRALRQL